MPPRMALLLLAALSFAACVHVVPPAADRAPASRPEPKRAIVLVLDGLKAEAPPLQALARLATHGVGFAASYAGALPLSPSLELAMLFGGKLPKSLPWQDELFVDVRGTLGKRGGVHLLGLLPAAKWKALTLAAASESALVRLVKAKTPGDTIAVAPDERASAKLEGLGFDTVRTSPSPTPAAVADALVAALAASPAFRVLAAVVPASDAGAADEALLRFLTRLETENRFADTVVVAVASSRMGASPPRYYGALPGAVPPPAAYAPLFERGEVNYGIEDASSLRLWLKSHEPATLAKFARRAHGMAGIAEVYAKHDTGRSIQYVRSFRSRELAGDALRFAKDRHLELLNASATRATADIVVLPLSPALETLERLPLVVAAPQLVLPGATLPTRARLVDVTPMVLRLLGLPGTAALDGTDQPIEAALPRTEARQDIFPADLSRLPSE